MSMSFSLVAEVDADSDAGPPLSLSRAQAHACKRQARPRPRKRVQPAIPVFPGIGFGGGDEGQLVQGFMHFIDVARLGPGFVAHALNSVGVQRAQVVGGRGIGPAARHHGVRAAFFQRRIVQEERKASR